MQNKKVTYKQPVKERSRELIWNHAIESITFKRAENRILNVSYMEHLWHYCQEQLEEHLYIETFEQWKMYADICYGKKNPDELKVAFFCGNEPENDVQHLLRLGVRIENIHAFEYNSQLFKEAVESLHDTYPLLKIYKGKIEQYAELQNVKFDVVYLDFTGPLTKEYKTVVKLLDMNALTDMSVLIINTCYPEKTPNNIDILTNFFFNDTFFENSVYKGEEKKREEGDTWFYRVESCSAYGMMCSEDLRPIIDANFEYAYSAYQTALILDYANRHKAAYEVFKKTTLSNRMLNSDILKDMKLFKQNFHDVLAQDYAEDGLSLPSSQFLEDGFIEKKDNGLISRLDAMRVAEVFVETPYHHYTTIYSDMQDDDLSEKEFLDANLKQILSEEVKEIVENIKTWFHGRYDFCDQPMEHLWLELLLFQLGHPYHTNVGNHRRYSYTAKQNKMCIDIFTLDKCRALYDWMPMMEYFIHDMKKHDRQMISRMCMDAIEKQILHIVDEIYFGAALVGINEYEWSKNKVLPNRQEII